MGIAYLVGKKKKKKLPPFIDDSGNVYGVKIDRYTTDPTSAVTYIEDSIGFTPARGNNGNFNYGSWNDKFPFNRMRPCIVRAGEVTTYLNPNDFTRNVNGTYIPLATLDGNVMIEIPKIYYKIQTNPTTSEIEVRYSGEKIDDDYKCYAHLVGEEERDFLYIGAFLSSNQYSRSLPSYAVTTNGRASDLRQSVKLNSGLGREGYALMGYNQIVLLQTLFLVMFKSRDYRTLGVGKNATSTTRNTGTTLTKGMFYGTNNAEDKVKFCGIEDFYGNYECYIDGSYIGTASGNNYGLVIGYNHNEFNGNGNGYVSYQGTGGFNANQIVSVAGTTELGYMPTSVQTKLNQFEYWVNDGQITASRYLLFGGFAGATNSPPGAFKMRWSISEGSSNIGSSVTTRIMFL